MFLGQFRQTLKEPGEKEEPEVTEKPPEAAKSSSPEEFLGTQKAREFVSRWAKKTRDGRPLYTKRGVTALLRALFGSYDSDENILESAEEVLNMLGGMDGLQGFLAGWKAKSEGIIKGLKSVLGGE
jgi:hypothetical protein